MASGIFLSSGLGVYGSSLLCKFVDKSLIRQLASVRNEKGRTSKRNAICLMMDQRVIPADRGRGNCRRDRSSKSPMSSPAPVAHHGKQLLVDANFDGSFSCRALAGGTPGIVEEVETMDMESFIEIGYIADTHGVRGELHVHSLTDFPEERFEKPGARWLRTRSMGRPSFQKVELLKGRVGPGKRPSWLVTLKDVNTPERASQLVGSTILVQDDEKPSLHTDEFYIPDLVGMTVALVKSGEEIGVILDVFRVGGGNDLLQVRLASSGNEDPDRKVWIPFVREIVPVVDTERRRVEVDPPEGLLELNAPAKRKDVDYSQKEDIKEKRKLRRQLGGLKKKLTAMGQTHVLSGLTIGTKAEQSALLEQLLRIDFETFQQAIEASVISSSSLLSPQIFLHPEPPPPFPRVNWQHLDMLLGFGNLEDATQDDLDMRRWWREGLQLIADGRVAVVALAGGQSSRLGESAPAVKGMADLGLPGGKSLFQLQAERLRLIQELAFLVIDGEVNPFIPWIIMTSDATDTPTREYFEKESNFGLDESQVRFIKQDSMPCVNLQSTHGRHDILMETPWKVAEAPNGNGGLFSALHGEGMIDDFTEEGIEYVQVYAVDNALVRVADPVFFGYTRTMEADIGIKVVTKKSPHEAVGVLCLDRDERGVDWSGGDTTGSALNESSSSRFTVLEYSEIPEELRDAYEDKVEKQQNWHSAVLSTPAHERLLQYRAAHICVNIFSVEFLKRLANSDFQFKFHPAQKKIPHFEERDGEWSKIVPEAPNGVKLELFIFDAFKFCDPDKVAVLEVRREEEFAPVKNASGFGLSDTVDTARDLVLAHEKRLLSSTFPEPENLRHDSMRKILVAYLCGQFDDDCSALEIIRRTDTSDN